jgi:hypothetical protein
VRLWDVSEGRLLREFFGHLNGAESLAFSPDGKTLATAGSDARCRLWDVPGGKRLRQVRGADTRKTVAFSPDGRTLLVADNHDGGMALWAADTGAKRRDLGMATGGRRRVLCPAFLPGGRRVVSLETTSGREESTEVRFWDADTGQMLRSVKAPSFTLGISGCALSPDGKTLAVGTGTVRDPVIQLWETDSGTPLLGLRGHAGYVVSLAFSPDGKTLASGGWDTTVLLWDVPRARLIGLWWRLTGDREVAAQAARLLAANPEGTVPFVRGCLRRAAEQEAPYARLLADLDHDRFEVRERASRRLEAAGPAAELALKLALVGDPSPEVRRRARQAPEKVTAPREAEVLRLVADLEGEKDAEALRRLREMGRDAEPALRRALAQPPSPRAGGGRHLSPRALSSVRLVLEQLREPDGSSIPITAEGVLRSLQVLEQVGTPEARQALEGLAKGPAESRLAREARAALERLAKRARTP